MTGTRSLRGYIDSIPPGNCSSHLKIWGLHLPGKLLIGRLLDLLPQGLPSIEIHGCAGICGSEWERFRPRDLLGHHSIESPLKTCRLEGYSI